MIEWWHELPERDCEYVTYYPVNIRPLAADEVASGETDGRFGFGFYVHVPFCDQICPFCNYNKFRSNVDLAPFVEALCREIQLVRRATAPDVQRVDFIYFGGGTPSVLSPDQIHTVLGAINEGFDATACEVTLECHPTHASARQLDGYRRAGVTRMSFGVQSLSDDWLTRIGSYHTAADAEAAVTNARAAGFDNVCIDLMFLLPGQTVGEWQRDLLRGIELDVDHVSTYRLALDPVGPLGRQLRSRRLPSQAEEDVELEMAGLALTALSTHGYRHYGSCSSAGFDFARPGRESTYEVLHRAAPQCEYAAVGPGAVGHLNGFVYWNIHTVPEYLGVVASGQLSVLAGRKLTLSDRQSRYAVLGVKHLALPLEPYREMFGESFESSFAAQIGRLKEFGVAEIGGDDLVVTPKGVHYMDNISKTFFNSENYRFPQPYKPSLQMMSVDLYGAD